MSNKNWNTQYNGKKAFEFYHNNFIGSVNNFKPIIMELMKDKTTTYYDLFEKIQQVLDEKYHEVIKYITVNEKWFTQKDRIIWWDEMNDKISLQGMIIKWDDFDFFRNVISIYFNSYTTKYIYIYMISGIILETFLELNVFIGDNNTIEKTTEGIDLHAKIDYIDWTNKKCYSVFIQIENLANKFSDKQIDKAIRFCKNKNIKKLYAITVRNNKIVYFQIWENTGEIK